MANTSPASPALRIGGYTLGSTLGVGTFGKVKRATHILSGVNVAVKILNRGVKVKALKMDSKIKREIGILQLFHHPHIIRLYEVIETSSDVFMFMEFVSGGELFDLIVQKGKLDEHEARRFFQQILSGVQYCHHHRVVHRDLKPENLLLDHNGNVKIADFGLSNIMEDGAFLQTSCGSPNYAAPEVISGQMYSGQEIDVWSCGVILYALVVGKLPFDEDYIPTLFQKIRNGVFNIPPFISQGCADLIRRLLDIDPITRITVVEVKQHPWFLIDLPRYLAEDSATLTKAFVGLKDLDHSLVETIVMRSGLPRTEVLQKLQSDTSNDILVTYNLLLDTLPGKGMHVSASGNSLLMGDADHHDDGLDSDGDSRMMLETSGDSIVTDARSFATSPPMNLREESSLIPVPGMSHGSNSNSMGSSPFSQPSRSNSGALGGNNGLMRQLAASPMASATVFQHLQQQYQLQQQQVADVDDEWADAEDSLVPTGRNTSSSTPSQAGSLGSVGSFGSGTSTGSLVAPGGALSKSWFLGVLTSKAPDAVMVECYRVLRLCDYEWKCVTKFHVRVRPVLRKKRAMSMQKKRKSAFGIRGRDGAGPELEATTNDNCKFEIQLYRVSSAQCLLDFKRISDEGTIMAFVITAQTMISILNLGD